jgi:hypothetical protein
MRLTERGQKTSLLPPEFWRRLEALFFWANLFWQYCLNGEGCRVLMYLQEGCVRNGEDEHATLILAVDREAGSQLKEYAHGYASAGQSRLQHTHVVLLRTVLCTYG